MTATTAAADPADPAMPAGDAGPGRRSARDSFELFAECLLTGVVVAVLAVPLVTLLPVVAAAVRHLRRVHEGEGGGVRVLLRETARACRGSWAVSGALLALLAVLGLNAVVAGGGQLPGGAALRWVMVALAAAALVVALRAAATWSPGASWRALVTRAAARSAHDPGGSVLVAAACGLVGLLAWMLPPLVLPGAGIVVLGLLAVEGRLDRR
ncbi:hypothetical protein [Kineococcus glutinatus]|uniref:Membrane protein YesL n=1 Tax=Kineococcus glutinatus TaxID=1070872 RepID=A0ABP9HV74_9ACTN